MRLRARCLLAMGLPITSCAESEPHPSTVAIAPPPTVSASQTATEAPTATVTATVVATATTTTTATATAAPRGLSNVPNFTAEYPHVNNRGCRTAFAHCYMLSDLKKLASAGATCPASEDVPQGCMGGAVCRDPDARTTGPLLAAVSQTQTAAKHATACCYEVPDLCCAGCGRALRDGARVVVTGTARRADWADADAPAASGRFAAMAAAEHASIASFARTSLELLALGAPPRLIEDTHRAALDEIEHARLAYALAGDEVGPAPLPMPPHEAPTFASFAVSTFVDACVGESLGADDVRRAARDERDPRVAAILDRIADDEERHVELAFRTLAWTVRAGGDPARNALENAVIALDVKTRARPVVAEVVVPCVRALLDATGLAARA